MLLRPRKTKYKKSFKRKIKGTLACKKKDLYFGEFGLKSLENGWVNFSVFESLRRAIVKKTNRKVKIWFRASLDLPLTKKPAEVRMGKGKGSLHSWIYANKSGHSFVEITGTDKKSCLEALRYAQTKFSMRTKIISRDYD